MNAIYVSELNPAQKPFIMNGYIPHPTILPKIDHLVTLYSRPLTSLRLLL